MELKKAITRSVDHAYRLARAVQTHDPSALEPRQQEAFWTISRIVVQLSLLAILRDLASHNRAKGGW